MDLRSKDHIEALVAYDLDERRSEDDVWKDVALGSREPGEVLDERAGLEPPEVLRRKQELFSPPDEESWTRMRDGLIEQFYPSIEAENNVSNGPAVPAFEERRWRGRPTRRTTVWLSGLLAAAAAIALLWVVQRPEAGSDLEMMPLYRVEFIGPQGDMRGVGDTASDPQPCRVTYHEDSSVHVVLSPAGIVQGDVAVAAWAESRSGASRRPRLAPPQQAPDGTLTIGQDIRELGLDPGIWTLTFAIARKGQDLDGVELLHLPPGPHPGVAVVRGTICIAGPRAKR